MFKSRQKGFGLVGKGVADSMLNHLTTPARKQASGLFVSLAMLVGMLGFSPVTFAYFDKGQACYAEHRYDCALKWFRIAAKGDDHRAQYHLGRMYQLGQGVAKDYKESLHWYRLAADQGHARSQMHVGLMYAYGFSVKQDYKEALKWYELASNQGDPAAQYALANMYLVGQGVKPNVDVAKRLFSKSCLNGYKGGCDKFQSLSGQGY